jgi:hypothetical protein
MKAFLSIIFLAFYASSYAQTSTDQADIGSPAVLVQTKAGSGSGFYLTDSTKNYICLVTASHIVIDPQKK